MSEQSAIKQAAQFLHDAHKARSPFGPIPEAFRPRTVEEAYDVQDLLLALRSDDGHRAVVGYKIGLTTPVMREMTGVDEPCAGGIFADGVHASPATVPGADFVRLGIECEIAVRLGADLPASGAPYDRKSVGEAITACAAAIEIIEDRDADYSRLSAVALIADNTWNAGIVTGPWVTEWRGLDLVTVRGVMEVNGKEMGEGRGGDVMGHPFESLAWLANMLIGRGKYLAREMIVMTGSIAPTQYLVAGEKARVAIEGLGVADLTVA